MKIRRYQQSFKRLSPVNKVPIFPWDRLKPLDWGRITHLCDSDYFPLTYSLLKSPLEQDLSLGFSFSQCDVSDNRVLQKNVVFGGRSERRVGLHVNPLLSAVWNQFLLLVKWVKFNLSKKTPLFLSVRENWHQGKRNKTTTNQCINNLWLKYNKITSSIKSIDVY